MSGGSRSSASASLVGSLLGRYRLERLLGEGGMGVVYAARHEDLGKAAAVKVLNERHDASDEVRTRFLREGQSASRIRHPNIVDVYDVGTQDGRAYLVMELLQGEDLRALLDREGPLSPERTADLLVPVLSALAAAHDIGVIHRDLKPDNVFVAQERNSLAPKVLDFGISKFIDHAVSTSLTGTGALLGTPHYMSPEQAQATKNIDARSDQYAIGVILYECVTGRRPVEETSIYPLIQRIVHGDFAPPRQLKPDLPAAFEQLILKAMASDPAARFADMRAMGRTLQAFAGDRVRANFADDFAHDPPPAGAAPAAVAQPAELRTTMRESVHERESRTKRPTRWTPALGLGGAVLLSVGFIAAMVRPGTKPEPAPAAAAAPAAPVTAALAVPPDPLLRPAGMPAPAIERRKTLVSDPPGAAVSIAGVKVGETPYAVSVPEDGPLKVELSLAGYEALQREIVPSDAAEVAVTLVRKTAEKKGASKRTPRGSARPELAPR